MNFYNNKYRFQFFLVFIIFLFGKSGIAQTSITGKVSDKDTGEEMIAANIIVTKNGIFIQGETTDIDGDYIIKLDSGTYDIEVSYTGYPTQKITGIVAIEGQATKVDIQLSTNLKLQIMNIVVRNICVPIIQQDETSTGMTITSEKIRLLPTRNLNKIITITPGVSFTQ
jgi:hypothetical protein